MKTAPPVILPLFRSDEQARLLTEIYLRSPQGSSLAALARSTSISPGGAHKEVERLERAGLVASERVGRTRIVRPNEASPFYADLRSLLLKAFGPAPRLHAAISEIEGIEDAFIFGSWVRAIEGELERPPQDIDLMVIGEVDLDMLYERLVEAEADLGRLVNVTVYTPAEWAADTSGFARRVREQPKIALNPFDDD